MYYYFASFRVCSVAMIMKKIISMFLVSPAAERLRHILSDDDATPTPTLFTEMDTLQHEGDELEWKESARYPHKHTQISVKTFISWGFKSHSERIWKVKWLLRQDEHPVSTAAMPLLKPRPPCWRQSINHPAIFPPQVGEVWGEGWGGRGAMEQTTCVNTDPPQSVWAEDLLADRKHPPGLGRILSAADCG